MKESSGQANKHTVTQTENRAKVVTTFFAWWRSDIPKELSYKYWRDIHGVWAARTPGFYQYRQLHLDNVDNTLANLSGIETDLPKVDQPDGMAHIFYSSPFYIKLLRLPFALKQAEKDETYFVARNAFQQSTLPLSRTYVDNINNPKTNGQLDNPRYVLAFKKKESVSDDDFRNNLVQNFAEYWRTKETVQRLRLELLEPYVIPPTTPDGTNHAWDKDKQYQAWIEVALSSDTQLISLFDTITNYEQYISAIHAYPIREIYTFVYAGKPTLVGLRGYPAVEIIEATGADFQKSKQVLEFTYGSVIHGAKLLGQDFYIILISILIIGALLYWL